MAESAQAHDLSTAIFLVETCSQITWKCQEIQMTRTKEDRTPVTQADYAVQALATLYLEDKYGSDVKLCAEEDGDFFEEDKENTPLLRAATNLVNDFYPFYQFPGREKFTTAEVLESLKRGLADPSKTDCWLMDPIDGTNGYVNGAQYAVALGKVEGGDVKFAVVSCPHIPPGAYCDQCRLDEGGKFYHPPETDFDQKQSWIIAAAKNGGCRQSWFKLGTTNTKWEEMNPVTVSEQKQLNQFKFCESINFRVNTKGYQQAQRDVGIRASNRPTFRLDSMAKYALVAAGQIEAYLRFSAPGIQKTWDHLGSLLVHEAGGRVTDVLGKVLDFSVGRRLTANREIVVSNGSCHQDLLRLSKTELQKNGVELNEDGETERPKKKQKTAK